MVSKVVPAGTMFVQGNCLASKRYVPHDRPVRPTTSSTAATSGKGILSFARFGRICRPRAPHPSRDRSFDLLETSDGIMWHLKVTVTTTPAA